MEYCAFVEPQLGASYAEQVAFAQASERAGFTGFFRSDHYLAAAGSAGLPGPSDSWTVLGGLARETSHVRLGTLVSSATFRHPGVLAIQVANVDEMSGGRVELGLGAGWNAEEHAAYGIPFPKERFGRFEDNLAIVTGLWATPPGATFSYSGTVYSLTDAPALPKPTQERIPVIVGGAARPRSAALAARFASEFNSFAGEEESRRRFDRVRAACDRIGRDPATIKLSVVLSIVVGTTRSDLDRRVANLGFPPADLAENPAFAIGGPAEIADRIARLEAIGASRVYLQFLDIRDLEHVGLVGAEVLPARSMPTGSSGGSLGS